MKFDHEDLKTNLIGQVKRMQDFLKGPYMEDELKGRRAKAISKGIWFKNFNPSYKISKSWHMQSVVMDTLKMLQKNKHGLGSS